MMSFKSTLAMLSLAMTAAVAAPAAPAKAETITCPHSQIRREVTTALPGGWWNTPIVNSLGFDLNRIFNELPIVALIMTLTETGALLIDALARSNDQQLAGAIIFLLTASIVGLNFITDILLALIDPRIRKGIMG